MTIWQTQPVELTASDCRACGACCSFSAEWPRFSLESDADLDRIPRVYADREHGRMRCSGNRCAALVGHVGISTACTVYGFHHSLRAFFGARSSFLKLASARARASFGSVANVVSFFGEAADARQFNRARRVGYASYLCSPLRI